MTLISCDHDDGSDISDSRTIQAIYTLPVVVHVIHDGEPIGEGFNLSKERIVSQITSLNHDFRRVEGTLGDNDHPDGADALIEFVLAQIGPDGKPTDGINRIDHNDVDIISDTDDTPFDWLPQYSYWDPDHYINIWLLPGAQDLLLGSAQLPHADLPGLEKELKTAGDGIFINTLHFGESDLDSRSNHGRTLTHEMGHFLGLLHLWGETEGGDGCAEHDDYCDDTPPVTKRTGKCVKETIMACNGQHALTQNYMDYIPDVCMNMFTNDQVLRMHYVLENAERRRSLTTSSVIER